jgi:hypothetical protein
MYAPDRVGKNILWTYRFFYRGEMFGTWDFHVQVWDKTIKKVDYRFHKLSAEPSLFTSITNHTFDIPSFSEEINFNQNAQRSTFVEEIGRLIPKKVYAELQVHVPSGRDEEEIQAFFDLYEFYTAQDPKELDVSEKSEYVQAGRDLQERAPKLLRMFWIPQSILAIARDCRYLQIAFSRNRRFSKQVYTFTRH